MCEHRDRRNTLRKSVKHRYLPNEKRRNEQNSGNCRMRHKLHGAAFPDRAEVSRGGVDVTFFSNQLAAFPTAGIPRQEGVPPSGEEGMPQRGQGGIRGDEDAGKAGEKHGLAPDSDRSENARGSGDAAYIEPCG